MLTVSLFTVLTVILLLVLARPPGEVAPTTVEPVPAAAPEAAPSVVLKPAPAAETERKFLFDVSGHSADEFRALLLRAQKIYEESDPDARSNLEVVMVLHGPDIQFFAADRVEDYGDIVDLAAKLDAFGVFDFKLCAATASRLGVSESEVPAFVEFVPYGPQEVNRLEAAGFVRL